MALRHTFALLAVLVCGGSAACLAAEATSARTVGRVVEPLNEIVNIPTADGLQLAGYFTLPAAGVAVGAPVVVLLPDGPGGTPLRTDDPSRTLARGLAREGYAVLSLETRHSTQYAFARFDEAFQDVKAALDLAASRGYPTAVLGGAGLGSLLAARYVAESGDGRVKALLAFGPSVDLPANWRARVGEDAYVRTIAQATKGAGESNLATSGFIDIGNGVIFAPGVFLDWYGATAKTSMTATLAAVQKPVLLAAGGDDPSVPAGRLQALAQAVGSKKVLTKSYPGAGHDLSRARDQVVLDAAAWLAGVGLAPPPRVVTDLVDTRAVDGTALSGVLYTPAGPLTAASRRAVFMLVPSFNGDAMRGLTHTLGMHLAQRGYTALVVRTRSTGFRNILSAKLGDIPKDIGAWSAFLGARGASRIIGVGHAIGGLWLSVYLSESQDKRFRGAVYLSPPRDLPAHARRGMGEETYERVIARAEAAVKEGKGASTLITTPYPQPVYDEDPRQPMFLPAAGAGYLNAYADAFLSYWAPESRAVHHERIAEIKLPIFALGGSRDAMMQGGWLLQFIKSARGPSASIFYGGPNGAPASFEGFESKVTDDVIGWAQRLP